MFWWLEWQWLHRQWCLGNGDEREFIKCLYACVWEGGEGPYNSCVQILGGIGEREIDFQFSSIKGWINFGDGIQLIQAICAWEFKDNCELG